MKNKFVVWDFMVKEFGIEKSEEILENYEEENDDIRSETKAKLDKTNAQLNAGSRIRPGN